MDTGEPAPLETRTQGIENGELRPSSMNGGTVQITIYGPDGTNSCSGQVVSRDTLLTAAHCFYDVGFYEGGYDSAIDAAVMVRHQNSDGSWEYPTAIGETVTVYVKSAYVSFANSGSNQRWGHDVAVVQRSSPFDSIVSSDVSALATDTNDRPANSYVYGHGYFADIFCDRGCNPYDDDQLRRGYLSGLQFIFPTNANSDYYGTIFVDYGPTSPHTCDGDSGGPWKNSVRYPPNVSGLQFGVHVAGSPDGECGADWTRSASVAFNAIWIKSKIQLGDGACTTTALAYYFDKNSFSTLPGDAFKCW